jgi:hypothetical protein
MQMQYLSHCAQNGKIVCYEARARFASILVASGMAILSPLSDDQSITLDIWLRMLKIRQQS